MLQDQGQDDGTKEKEHRRVVLIDTNDQGSGSDSTDSPPLTPGAPPPRGSGGAFPDHHYMFSDMNLDFVSDLSDDAFLSNSSASTAIQGAHPAPTAYQQYQAPPYNPQQGHRTIVTNPKRFGGIHLTHDIFDFTEVSRSLPDSHGVDSTLFPEPSTSHGYYEGTLTSSAAPAPVPPAPTTTNEDFGGSFSFTGLTQSLGYPDEASTIHSMGNFGSLQDTPNYIFDFGTTRARSPHGHLPSSSSAAAAAPLVSSSLGAPSMMGSAGLLSTSAGMSGRSLYLNDGTTSSSNGLHVSVGSLQDRPFFDNFSDLYLPKQRQYQQIQQQQQQQQHIQMQHIQQMPQKQQIQQQGQQQYAHIKLKQQIQPGLRAYGQRSQNTSKNVLQAKQSQSLARIGGGGNNSTNLTTSGSPLTAARNLASTNNNINNNNNNFNDNGNNNNNEESNSSRTLFVRNLNPGTEDGEIFRAFSHFGEVKNVSYQSKYRGFVTVTYYDIRSSMNALVGLQGRYLHGSPLDVYYSHEACRDGNQGSLHITLSAVPGLDPFLGPSVSGLISPENDIFCECAKYGEVKAVFPSSLGRNAYVAEFFDLRAAESAKAQLTSIAGRPIRVEYAAHTGFVGSSAPLMADMAPAQSAPFRANATPFKPRKLPPHLQRVGAASSSGVPFSSSTPANVVGPLAQNGLMSPTASSSSNSSSQMAQLCGSGNCSGGNGGGNVKRRTTPFADTRPQKQGVSGVNKGNGNVAQRYRKVPDNVKDFYSVCVVNGMVNDFRTTLMIRNIPNKYTQKMLLDSIDQIIPGSYNFFYLPIDFQNQCNVGYAFINMSNTKFIPALYERFHNKGWELFNSEKICEVAYARIQGLQKLVDHFRNSNLLSEDEKVRPVVLINGKLVPFPVGVSLVVKKISPNELIV